MLFRTWRRHRNFLSNLPDVVPQNRLSLATALDYDFRAVNLRKNPDNRLGLVVSGKILDPHHLSETPFVVPIRLKWPVNSGRAHLQDVWILDQILYVKNGAQLSADRLAIVEGHTPILVEKDSKKAP